MQDKFDLPKDAIGRFAVVKLWPDIKTAEDECIARLKRAATNLGLECVEVHADGKTLEKPETSITRDDVDFVIHLHYDTPKLYDAFSFVALWNPISFYHEWGYARTSRNLTTHDDFLSCSSPAADDHVARMVRKVSTHHSPHFTLYHSTPDIVHHPSLGELRLFYAGINWEAISGGKSRHQEVLKRLDKTGLLRIYGPTVFQGVRVWAGYQSYVKEVPFDGFSMIDEIAKAGVALVLSSQAHKDSELMSNRLFESVAAGALIICDENPFAKRYFGNSLLYIDTRAPVDKIVSDITLHLEWARSNQERALAMIADAQKIFQQKFNLNKNLRDLYLGLEERKHQIASRRSPFGDSICINLYLLLPDYSEAVLRSHVATVKSQDYQNFSPVLVIDGNLPNTLRNEIENVLSTSLIPIKVLEVEFHRFGVQPNTREMRRFGEILCSLLEIESKSSSEAFVTVAPNERIYSNHLSVLAGALQRDPAVQCAATAVVYQSGDDPIHSVSDLIDFSQLERFEPIGVARFIFRKSALPTDVRIALPYLDGLALAVLIGEHIIAQQMPATVVIDVKHEFPKFAKDDSVEKQIVWDYNPSAFNPSRGFGPKPQSKLTASPLVSKLQLARKLVNLRWIKAQVLAVRKQGLAARLQVLKRKMAG